MLSNSAGDTMDSSAAPPPAGSLPSTGSADRHGAGAAFSSSRSSSLHTVRKLPAKPWKKPTAVSPAPRPQVYRVDPRGFRLLVQRLTGAAELPPRISLLRDAAPAQSDLVPHGQLGGAPVLPPEPQRESPPSPYQVDDGRGTVATSTLESVRRGSLQGEVHSGKTTQTRKSDGGHRAEDDAAGAPSPSPSLYSAYLSWCNLPLPSPGTVESLDTSAVL